MSDQLPDYTDDGPVKTLAMWALAIFLLCAGGFLFAFVIWPLTKLGILKPEGPIT